jgi:hypothetical protein
MLVTVMLVTVVLVTVVLVTVVLVTVVLVTVLAYGGLPEETNQPRSGQNPMDRCPQPTTIPIALAAKIGQMPKANR